jgi:hypothetical protein
VASDHLRNVGIVDAFCRVRPHVNDFLIQSIQQLDDFALDDKASVIAANGNTHRIFSNWRAPSRLERRRRKRSLQI